VPIKKYHNTQLLFGVGGISVQIGYKRFKSPDAIQFVEVESLAGGVSAEIETNKKMKKLMKIQLHLFLIISKVYIK